MSTLTQTSIFEVKPHKPTQAERILAKLQEAGERGVTNIDLNKVCFRYGARLHELRKDGYTISTSRVKEGVFRFVLHEVGR